MLLVLPVLVLTGACSASPVPVAEPPEVLALRPEVIARLPHDADAFTQGLELADGVLYEGTGLRGRSSLRASDPDTGRVDERVDLPADLFGEGITVVGDRIWQITWRDGVAVERDRATLAELRRVSYDGEGWGLCHDGARLVMSDGSPELTFRDRTSFAETGRVTVTRDGTPVEELNELECVGGAVWANVWQTDEIVRVDPASGRVTAVADLAALKPAGASGVLNGIAAVPGTDEFLVTGKNWPTTFRVRLVGGP
ncbi:glutaminyl-peptide cyclotransferase [Umezawaea beigongshangensis]|uniref:glutaminyl-peptide cyclotransferase n=1 Tax=Umezawaea beigongshangensis TaxID=2780383 RepID=UPI0018F12DDA|nr:glutaminyl-peptide cyclotransferase [Umezawaea beigongshangensis]